MPNTYTQLYVHIVFAVRYREALLHQEWDGRLRQYITTITHNMRHKMLAINNVSDHLHMLIGFDPQQSISDLLREIKGGSSEWINKEKLTSRKFHWQHGYGAFSHSRSQIDGVVKYIANQQAHHARITFVDEYRKMLDDFGVEYDERYAFSTPE